jgi:3,4-dihydroxy 2-butanone 4-phosphate synthase/GTP cyclohydrolase II
MQAIKAADNGVLVLLNCGESAEQLFGQFTSLDAKGARPLGRAASMDLRTYGIGAQILKDLGVGKMQLLANPRKMPSMTGFDLEVTGYLANPGA